MTWEQILTRWSLVELDLHETYGVDLDEPGVMRSRRWRWLRSRVLGLLSTDSRLARDLSPKDTGKPKR